jgi:hypothetical protein
LRLITIYAGGSQEIVATVLNLKQQHLPFRCNGLGVNADGRADGAVVGLEEAASFGERA